MHIIYARKSSESEERQALSIPAQLEELKALATRRGLEVSRVFEESCSAKTPGRPVWKEVMGRVRKGEISGVLCWKLDRLARNPVDGGEIMWELGDGKLGEIVTPGRTFTGTSDDKLLMSIEFGMATKYVDDLSENVKRGNRKKLEAGWLPGRAPIGYLNDKLEKTVIRDPERFDLVRKMWELLLTRRMSPIEIQRVASEEWGLVTPKRKNSGGKPLSMSAVYKLFHNIFYTGFIMRDGELYEGAHEPMITKGEFDRAQNLIEAPSPAPHKHSFYYTGLMTCGECGASITAEFKKNRHGTKYIYYHCTHGKPGVPCRQRSIQEHELELQIGAYLDDITLPADYHPFVLKHLVKSAENQGNDQQAVRKSLEQAIVTLDDKLAKLLDMRLQGLLTDEEYTSRKEAFLFEKDEKRFRLEKLQEGTVEAIEPARYALSRLVELKAVYFRSTGCERRQILNHLLSHPILKDKTLLIQLKKPFSYIGKRPSFLAWYAITERFLDYYAGCDIPEVN